MDKLVLTVRLVWACFRGDGDPRPPDNKVEFFRPDLGFLLANRDCSTNSLQYEICLELLRGLSL